MTRAMALERDVLRHARMTMRRVGSMLTFRNILCPIDFSEVSRAAFRQAVALAGATHGVVHVIHAIDAPSLAVAEGRVLGGGRLAGEARGADAQTMRAWLAEQRVKDVPVEHHLVAGPPARAIIDEASALSCDAIVMGTHGRVGLARAVLGSVAETIVRTSPIPTLVVPNVRQEDAGAPRAIGSILCPVDFSERSERALSEAARLGKTIGAVVHVVHCWQLEPRFDVAASERRHRDRDLSDELTSLTKRCAPAGTDVRRHLRHGAPHLEIVALAVGLDVDLIVMGTHGRTGLEHFLLGSVAERVVRTSPVPVLTMRAPRPLPN